MSIISKYAYYAYSSFELLAGIKNWRTLFPLFFSRHPAEISWLELRKGGTRMAVRGSMDAWSVKESMIDRFYSRHGMQILPPWVVVDIGAAIGEFTVLAGQKASSGQVYAFEPNPNSLKILNQNLIANNLTNVHTFELGVWSRPCQLCLNLEGGEPLQAQSLQGGTSKQQLSFQAITISDIINEITKKPIDLLKLDCEGAEYEILLSCNAETLTQLKRIVMEYHDLGGQKTHLTLEKFLTGQGFHIYSQVNPVHAEIGYLYAQRAEQTIKPD